MLSRAPVWTQVTSVCTALISARPQATSNFRGAGVVGHGIRRAGNSVTPPNHGTSERRGCSDDMTWLLGLEARRLVILRH